MEDLEARLLEYKTAGKFLADVRKEFRGEDEESVRVAELRRLEQGERIMKEFIQEFRRAARGSEYEGRPLVEEFKKRMSGVIRRMLMEAERPLTSIEQWYECTTNLDKYWRESRRDKERLRKRKDTGPQAPRQNQEAQQ